MNYIFDTGIFIDLFRHYYPDQFPSLWKKFHPAIENGNIISVRESLLEILKKEDEASAWANEHKEIFFAPTTSETDFVARIFRERPHFQQLVNKQQQLEGTPCADPFVIAKAHIDKGCVVTTEKFTENAGRIPNICKHFNVECTDFEGFMKSANWKF